MKLDRNSKILIINTIAIFLAMFLFSNIYKWIPNIITAFIFPINESLFEHLKMMYASQIIISLITYIILKFKNIKFSNYLSSLLTTTIFTIIVFFLIYLPIYNRFGEGLLYTMIIYTIVLIISQIIFYYLSKKEHNKELEIVSMIIIPIIFLVLGYLTFNPPKTSFFFDTITESYGYYQIKE